MNNERKVPTMMDALYNAIENVSGKEIADRWRAKDGEARFPEMPYDLNDSDFEDDFPEDDVFGADAAAADEVWHD